MVAPMLRFLRRTVNRKLYFSYSARHSSSLKQHHFDIDVSADYTDKPEYPPIRPVDYWSKKKFKRMEWYDQIQALPTVEEKMLEIAKNAGRPFLFMIHGVSSSYYNMPFMQSVTRTHILKGLPDFYNNINIDALYETVKPKLVNAILYGLESATNRNKKLEATKLFKNYSFSMTVMEHLHQTMQSCLAVKYPHIHQSETDIRVRIDAAWKTNIVPTTKQEKKYWSRTENLYGDAEKIRKDTWFQYSGQPLLQLRTEQPLPQILPLSDELCNGEVEEYYHCPRTAGFGYTLYDPVTLPGVWPATPCRFSHLSVHPLHRLIERRFTLGSTELEQEVIDSAAILAGYGTLHGSAYLQGFSMFHELTYPLTTQLIFTDGRFFTFYNYQLNTITLGNDFVPFTRRNLLWTTEQQPLYESWEGDQLKGLNDDVLKTLLKMYVYEPRAREGVDMTPYLGEDSNLSDEEWTEAITQLRRFYDNRPLASPPRELPQWEKIHKKWFYVKID